MKKIILFGCGKIGKQVLKKLGRENVAFFIDNDEMLYGKQVEGIKIYNLKKLQEISLEDFYLMISSGKNNSISIAEQLIDNGIIRFFDYDEFDNFVKGNYLNYNECCDNTLVGMMELYRSKIEQYQTQLTFVKDHVRAGDITKAVGYERKEQLDVIDFASDFVNELEEIGLKPFLICGALLGKLRHNGMIPWDDDVDFGLMREDYEQLIKYCREKYAVKVYNGLSCDICEQVKFIEENIKICKDYFLAVFPEHVQINKGTSLMNRKIADFFCFDRYGDYDFFEYKKIIIELKQAFDKAKTAAEKYEIISKIKEKEARYRDNNGKNIYFSLESFLVYARKNDTWIPAETIFPLKRIQFEGRTFWAPNKMEEYLKFEYKNYWSIPDDFGISTHDSTDVTIRERVITVEFYLTGIEEILSLKKLYDELRQEGVYARFVIERATLNSKNIKKQLQKYNLEYSEYCNRNANVVIVSDFLELQSRYIDAIKIIVTDNDFMFTNESKLKIEKIFDYKYKDGKFIKNKSTCDYKNNLKKMDVFGFLDDFCIE